MRRLIRRLAPPRRPGEPGDHGAAAIMVAVFLSTGILFAMTALVIDVGLLYHEKEQLQSGADAGSWKAAQSCVARPDPATNCNNTVQTANARTYAAANAKDGRADAQACLNNQNCTLPWNTTAACPPQPATTGNYDYVEVRTSTRTKDGQSLIPPTFTGPLVSGYQGRTVGACARVAWGAPAEATVLALGISQCDWERMTQRNSVFYALPLLDPLLQQSGLYSVLGLQPPVDNAITVNNPLLSWCDNAWDHTSPSGYAWLGTPNAACQLTIAPTVTPEFWLNSLSLNLAGAINCTAALSTARARGTPVLVPIFDKAQGVIGLLPARYRIVGFAPFVVTGYTGLLGGLAGAVSSLSNTVPAIANLLCGLQLCIYGYFTRSVLPRHMPTRFGAGRNFGVTVIGRTG